MRKFFDSSVDKAYTYAILICVAWVLCLRGRLMTTQEELTKYVDSSLSQSVTGSQRDSIHQYAQKAFADQDSFDRLSKLCDQTRKLKIINEAVLECVGYQLAQKFKNVLDNRAAEEALNQQAALRGRRKACLVRCMIGGQQEDATDSEWSEAKCFCLAFRAMEKHIKDGGKYQVHNAVRGKLMEYGASHFVFDQEQATVYLLQPKYMGGKVSLSVGQVIAYGNSVS